MKTAGAPYTPAPHGAQAPSRRRPAVEAAAGSLGGWLPDSPETSQMAAAELSGSLLFDFELLDLDSDGEVASHSPDRHHVADVTRRLDQVTQLTSAFANKLMHDVYRVCEVALLKQPDADRMRGQQPLSVASVAVQLHQMGYALRVRHALGSPSSSFQHLRHKFLLVSPPKGIEDGPLVVDVSFREQWCLPNPSPMYSAILENVPEVLVAPAASVQTLVKLLSQEVARSFEVMERALPPWRTYAAMKSKWAPAKLLDEPVAGFKVGAKVKSGSPGIDGEVMSRADIKVGFAL